MKRRVLSTAALVAAGLLLVAGCAAGPNALVDDGTYGFWWGLWHGMILPITFVVSLFTDTVNIYEVDNNGNWYDVGFVVGLALFSAPAMAARSRPPR